MNDTGFNDKIGKVRKKEKVGKVREKEKKNR